MRDIQIHNLFLLVESDELSPRKIIRPWSFRLLWIEISWLLILYSYITCGLSEENLTRVHLFSLKFSFQHKLYNGKLYKSHCRERQLGFPFTCKRHLVSSDHNLNSSSPCATKSKALVQMNNISLSNWAKTFIHTLQKDNQTENGDTELKGDIFSNIYMES